jgi:hypothetical protein
MTYNKLVSRSTRAAVAGVFSASVAGTLFAAPATTTTDTTAITPAGDSIKAGDRLGLKVDATIFTPVVEAPDSKDQAESKGSPDSKPVQGAVSQGSAPTKRASGPFCAPAGTLFKVDSVEPPTTNINGTKDSEVVKPSVTTDNQTGATTTTFEGATNVKQVQTDTTLRVHIKTVGKHSAILGTSWLTLGVDPGLSPCLTDPETYAQLQAKVDQDKKNNDSAAATADAKKRDTWIAAHSAEQVVKGQEYTITATQVGHYGTFRNGWTWGALTIPYKYELSDHSFQAKPSIAPYAGYETWGPGFNFAGVIAIGIGGSSQSAQTSGSSSTTNGTGNSNSTNSGGGTQALYTAGAGFIFTLGGSFKGGILVGKDWAGSSTGFKYEGKTWLAITFGKGFG